MDFSALLSNLFSVEGLIGLLTLSLLEIVLGIDNIIFIAIVADKLPNNQKSQARTTGLILAVFIRVALLFTLSYLSTNEEPVFHRHHPRRAGPYVGPHFPHGIGRPPAGDAQPGARRPTGGLYADVRWGCSTGVPLGHRAAGRTGDALHPGWHVGIPSEHPAWAARSR